MGHYSRQFPFYPIHFSYFKAENTTTGISNRQFSSNLAIVAFELADSILGYWHVRKVRVRAGLVPYPKGFSGLPSNEIAAQLDNNGFYGARAVPNLPTPPTAPKLEPTDNNLAFELVGNNADFSFQDCAMTNLKSKRGEITGDEFGTPSASTPSCIPKGNITTSYPSEFDTLDSDSSSSSSSSDSPSSD